MKQNLKSKVILSLFSILIVTSRSNPKLDLPVAYNQLVQPGLSERVGYSDAQLLYWTQTRDSKPNIVEHSDSLLKFKNAYNIYEIYF